jgi:hypothetical protein
MRRRAGLLMMGLSLWLGLAVAAQDSPLWTAWLYNPADGRMTLVDDTGEVMAAFNLPLPEGYAFYPFDVTVAQSGTRIAYVPLATSNQARRVLVYHVLERKLITDVDLSPLVAENQGALTEDAHSFNETGTALAFGLSPEEAGWQIGILDLESGRVTLILRSTSPNVKVVGIPTDPELLPVIQRYVGTQVMFTLVEPAATESQPERGSYTWNLTDNTVRVDTPYPAVANDYWSPTGEMIMAVVDADLPNESADFANQQANALYVYDPAEAAPQAAPYPFFVARDLSLFFPRFVQNGARILFGGLDAEGASGWLVIERDGSGVGEWRPPDGTIISSIQGTATGFLYMAEMAGGHATLFDVDMDTDLSTGTPIWSSAANDYPRLVWVGDKRQSRPDNARPWKPFPTEVEDEQLVA